MGAFRALIHTTSHIEPISVSRRIAFIVIYSRSRIPPPLWDLNLGKLCYLVPVNRPPYPTSLNTHCEDPSMVYSSAIPRQQLLSAEPKTQRARNLHELGNSSTKHQARSSVHRRRGKTSMAHGRRPWRVELGPGYRATWQWWKTRGRENAVRGSDTAEWGRGRHGWRRGGGCRWREPAGVMVQRRGVEDD